MTNPIRMAEPPEFKIAKTAQPVGPPSVWTATADWEALMQRLADSGEALPSVFLESATQAILAPLADFLHDPPRTPIDRWRAGRAFGTLYEVDWRMLDIRRVALTLLIETDRPAALPLAELGWHSSDLTDRLDPQVTQRTMPVIAPFGGRLYTLDYHDRQSGAVVISRLYKWQRPV